MIAESMQHKNDDNKWRKRMRYEGDIYRPPSEAYSLLVQVTIGCAHNKCTFCNMYKEKQFRVRNVDEVLEDLDWARAQYRRVERIFLCDGDALCLANHKLLKILDYIAEKFPECERVTTYGRAKDALRKTEEELRELRAHGLQMVYMGAESGSQRVLDMIKKGETSPVPQQPFETRFMELRIPKKQITTKMAQIIMVDIYIPPNVTLKKLIIFFTSFCVCFLRQVRCHLRSHLP